MSRNLPLSLPDLKHQTFLIRERKQLRSRFSMQSLSSDAMCLM